MDEYKNYDYAGNENPLKDVPSQTLGDWAAEIKRESGLSEDEQTYTQRDKDMIFAELSRRNASKTKGPCRGCKKTIDDSLD